jgi:hypothetical protein
MLDERPPVRFVRAGARLTEIVFKDCRQEMSWSDPVPDVTHISIMCVLRHAKGDQLLP